MAVSIIESTTSDHAEQAIVPSRRRRVSGRTWRALSLGLLLAGTAVLYLWGLSKSGYGNSFYAAAAQAGSQSWKAFLFGSLDASNAITVDKPPASLWLMALSVRMFGLSSWSILAPQALLGVASVGVLYAAVARSLRQAQDAVSGHVAGLVAGALLALTPVAALMFRFDNPDALLVFLMTAAAYATLRATEKASPRWLAGAGVLIGFAFLTKMLQAFLVLPAFVLVYLIAARTSLGKRIGHLLVALGALLVSAGWWVALVELLPASMRPYVGGSENNSELDLIFGYNGLGRILGQSGGRAGADGPGGGMWGSTGITRLFDGVSGGMISWLIPAALILGAFALVVIGRVNRATGAPRTDPVRAAIVLWAGWLLVTALTFSFMAGIYHDYYTVALAPAIAGLVAVAGATLWRQRHRWLARAGLAAATAAGVGWAFVLLGQAPAAYSTLRWPVLIAGLIAATGLLLANRLPRALAVIVLGLALVGGGTGPAAYALNTAATAHQGSIVTAGPVSAGGRGGGQFPVGPSDRDGGQRPPGQAPTGQPGGRGGQEAQANADVVALLEDGAEGFDWVAATTGSQTAATYQLATQQAVMAIGGFNGGDPSPTLAQFQAEVAAGRIHYYLAGEGLGGGPGGRDGNGSAAQIAEWVSSTFTARTVGGVTVYDLTQTG